MSDGTIEPAEDVATTHTTGRIEIFGPVSGRRRWTVEQLATLQDAFGPNGSVRAAVECHEVGGGAIYIWRRQAMSGALSGVPARPQTAFAEVRVCFSENCFRFICPSPLQGSDSSSNWRKKRGSRHRRRWTVEEKLAILRDAFGPDGSVRAAVERHEVGSGA